MSWQSFLRPNGPEAGSVQALGSGKRLGEAAHEEQTHLGWVDTNGGHGPPGVPVASLDLAEVMGGGGYTFILPVLEAGTCWLDTMPQVI